MNISITVISLFLCLGVIQVQSLFFNTLGGMNLIVAPVITPINISFPLDGAVALGAFRVAIKAILASIFPKIVAPVLGRKKREIPRTWPQSTEFTDDLFLTQEEKGCFLKLICGFIFPNHKEKTEKNENIFLVLLGSTDKPANATDLSGFLSVKVVVAGYKTNMTSVCKERSRDCEYNNERGNKRHGILHSFDPKIKNQSFFTPSFIVKLKKAF
ncbi:uncharacterized protein LOC143229169 [Tachypleus tridentatus]|uniref:uncharacterized protein LOC143229169 n=1 Tax=Tachypleus tridentatus TaxID=6853 RepID=UPI003FD1D81B